MLGALLSISAVYSCDQSNDHGQSHPGSGDKVLKYDVNAPFGSLDPFSVSGSGANHIFPLLYSYLFVPDTEGRLQPDLATRWTYDSQKRRWVIALRTDARFHNRQPVTARDVQYSLGKWVWEINPGLSATIDRIDPVSAHQLCIYLKKEDPALLPKLWSKEIVPSPDSGAVDYANHPVGSGPFQFSQRQGSRTVALKANPDYYGGRPALNRIIFFYQPDREKAWTRLFSRATDIAQEISPKNFAIIKQYQDRFYFDQYTLPHYTIMLYNTYDPLFSSPQVRKALTMGIDRAHIVRNLLSGYGKVATGPMGVDSPYGHPDLSPLPYAPHISAAQLKQNGWMPNKNGLLYKDGRPFEFTLFVFKESQIDKEVARFIQLSLNDLGIKVHLKALGFEALTTSYENNTAFQAVLTEMVGSYHRPEAMMAVWSSDSQSHSFAGNFDHPKVNRLMAKASAVNDPSEQQALLREIDALIASLQPGTFLFHKTALDAMSRRFHLPHPFSLTYEGIYRLKDASPRHR